MKKHCVAKVLLGIWEIFLHENNHNCNSYRCGDKFAFMLFLPFLKNQKEESGFQQVGGLETRNISVFCLKRVALYFKPCRICAPLQIMPSKVIFLHVITLRIIVPWFYQRKRNGIAHFIMLRALPQNNDLVTALQTVGYTQITENTCIKHNINISEEDLRKAVKIVWRCSRRKTEQH